MQKIATLRPIFEKKVFYKWFTIKGEKQARNPGTVEKRIANSGGRTDGTVGTDEIDGTDGKIATDPMQSLLPGFLAKKMF